MPSLIPLFSKHYSHFVIYISNCSTSLDLSPNMFVLTIVLLSASAVQNSMASSCDLLTRDVTTCSSGRNYARELYCVAKQNTMADLMSCVTDPTTFTDDKPFCRAADMNIGDGNIDNFLYTSGNLVCVTPRRVLLARSQIDCSRCGLTAAIRECPVDDPRFLDCLCHYLNTNQNSLNCLSKCFKPDIHTAVCDFAPGTASKQRKRDTGIEHLQSDVWNMKHEERNTTLRVSFYPFFFPFLIDFDTQVLNFPIS